jgi:serralysin
MECNCISAEDEGQGPPPRILLIGIKMHYRAARTIFLTAAVAALVHSTAQAYVPDSRWSITASGTTGSSGTPITLTWSIAKDGSTIPGEGASNLISYFDGLFNVTSGGGDLTKRPWFPLIQESFDRWNELGGITFQYEPNDNGSPLQTSSGVRGLRGDVRLSGAFIDGPSNTLAYTWLPNSGDVVVDTGESNFFSNSANNYRQLRNTLMHELGHAFGLLHIESSTENILMEPIINTSIDGPQLDDIRGIQGFYGDPLEKANGGLGNGTYQRATALGSLGIGSVLSVGSDGVGGQFVSPNETDFVSIANNSDVDFFSFTVDSPALLDVSLKPLGGVFNQGVEGGPQSLFDANARNDLSLAVFASNGTTLLGSANLTGAGGSEFLSDLQLDNPGTYYARVTGSSENVQLYELQLSASLPAVALPGDYNGDGAVNNADLTLLLNSWGESVPPPPTGWVGSPLTSPLVNNDELTALLNHWSQVGSGSFTTAGTVPEPGANVLLGFAGLACLMRFPQRARRHA